MRWQNRDHEKDEKAEGGHYKPEGLLIRRLDSWREPERASQLWKA